MPGSELFSLAALLVPAAAVFFGTVAVFTGDSARRAAAMKVLAMILRLQVREETAQREVERPTRSSESPDGKPQE
jgi:hypothetical protein